MSEGGDKLEDRTVWKDLPRSTQRHALNPPVGYTEVLHTEHSSVAQGLVSAQVGEGMEEPEQAKACFLDFFTESLGPLCSINLFPMAQGRLICI